MFNYMFNKIFQIITLRAIVFSMVCSSSVIGLLTEFLDNKFTTLPHVSHCQFSDLKCIKGRIMRVHNFFATFVFNHGL